MRHAERRHLTVLFSDLAGADALSDRLDPEDLHSLLHDYQAACAAAIAAHDGYLAHSLDTGALAYFGYPIAHEEDAIHAIRCGLGILGAVRRLDERYRDKLGVRLDARIGVHTGLVIVGDQEGDAEANAIVGATPTLAARIGSVAEPGELLVSRSTYRVIEGFVECRDLGRRALKGIAEEVSLFAVEKEGMARSRLDARAGNLTPLAGREKELETLRGAWRRAQGGEGQVVLLEGEPGIGKSRLLMAFRQEVENAEEESPSHAPIVTELRCSPDQQASPFRPVIELLESGLGFDDEETPDQRRRKVEAFAVANDRADTMAIELLLSLLSIPSERADQLLHLSPMRRRQETMELLLSILFHRAGEHPTLLIVEDLHWADRSSLELLDQLIARCDRQRLMIVPTYRPQFVPYWEPRSNVRRIELRGLPTESAGAIIAGVAEGAALPSDVTAHILAKTDGVPLFLEELTRSLIESGTLLREGSRYRLTRSLSGEESGVPVTLNELLMARLDRYPDAKPVAQLGAAIGRAFSYELLDAIPGPHRRALDAHLDRLVDAGLLFRKGRGESATYIFKHALIRDAAYSTLLKSARRDHHRLIAGALRDIHAGIAETQPELLAQHLTDAGESGEAVGLWMQAGQSAFAKYALHEAIDHLSAGVALVRAMPEGIERDGLELGFLSFLCFSYQIMKGWGAPELEEIAVRMQELCDRIGSTPEIYSATYILWGYRVLRGDAEGAVELAADLTRIAESLGNMPMILSASAIDGFMKLFAGRLAEGLLSFERTIAEYVPERDGMLMYTLGLDQLASARVGALLIRTLMGRIDPTLRAEIATLRDDSRVFPNPNQQCWNLAQLAMNHMFQGDPERTASDAAEAAVIAEQIGFAQWSAMADAYAGWAAAATGERVEEGIATVRRQLEWCLANGCEGNVPNIAILPLADVLLRNGRYDEAIEAVEEGERLLEQVTFRHHWVASELRRIVGEALIGKGEDVDGERAVRESLAMARAMGAGLFTARTALPLARLLRRTDRADEADRLLREVRAAFAEEESFPELEKVRELEVGKG